MEWRTIPGFETYEVNERGVVRTRATHYVMSTKGGKVSLWTGSKYVRFRLAELVAMVATTMAAEPDELTRLRRRVAELEAKLKRGVSAKPPVAAKTVPPKPPVTAKPSSGARKTRRCATCLEHFTPVDDERQCPQCRRSRPAQTKKRYCVVCGRELPSGFWRRCPEHAYRDGVHTEDDFSGSVAL